MPRTKNSKNSNNYHFIVWYKDDPDDETPQKKYFKTTKEITEEFGVCRSTIYNYYTKVYSLDSKKKNKIITGIDKLSTPIPIYKKILVEFD